MRYKTYHWIYLGEGYWMEGVRPFLKEDYEGSPNYQDNDVAGMTELTALRIMNLWNSGGSSYRYWLEAE